jgi:hypothetical protein
MGWGPTTSFLAGTRRRTEKGWTARERRWFYSRIRGDEETCPSVWLVLEEEGDVRLGGVRLPKKKRKREKEKKRKTQSL